MSTFIRQGASNPVLLIALTLILANSVQAQQPDNGEVRSEEGAYSVWSSSASSWVTPEVFWLDYAQQNDGKYWGRSREYPTYSEVSEHDTLLIETDTGICLMYFFHERWRRAQDVRRWDPKFNEIEGCPSVFD